jgi:hypothetical protein
LGALNENHYLSGGKLYFTPEDGAEELIGNTIDINIAIETQTAECLSRDNGAAEVVAEAVIRRDYTITFTTTNTASANLARFFYASEHNLVFAAGDTYLNGKEIEAFDPDTDYLGGEVILHGGKIYEVPNPIEAGAFDESEWTLLGGASVRKLTANAKSKIAGRLRFESSPLAGDKETIIAYKVSLAPSGNVQLVGDQFRELVFNGKCQRTADGVIDIFIEG